MDAERARAFLLSLPHVAETMQWGANLVFWVGDKAIGGKMFALIDLDGGDGPVMSFAAAGEHSAELLEHEGLRPAPYFGRLGWVAVERWNVLRGREWEHEMASAHAVIFAKLPPRTRALLGMPPTLLEGLPMERKISLTKRAAGKKPRA